MDIISGIILGLVQGITEFLPISSSGHLILVREVISIDDVNKLAIDAILHLATTLAILIYFWSDILVLIRTFMRKLGRLPVNQKDLILLYALTVGTIPAVILGLLLESIFDQYLGQAIVVGVMLFIASLFFMYTEWRYYISPPQGTLTVRRGFQIGLFQALALIPGFSRSGTTLAGGMLLGLSRYESARFSFLLAIPITFGLGLKKLFDLIMIGGEEVVWIPIIIATVISFVTALFVIHFFLAFIRRYTLWPFIWHSVILSSLTIYYLVFVV